jgi:hypothetical protein
VKRDELDPTFTLPKLCEVGDKAMLALRLVMVRPSAVELTVPPKVQVRVREVVRAPVVVGVP